ncbi:MAG: hypothetical protein IRZ03_10660 [Acidobacterium ailaaui]|nr:hypothetical protein [Pseudacidobacterium ailaaui]
MKNVIEILRKHNGAEGENYDEVRKEIESIIDVYKPEGYTVEEVHSEFEEGGRWTNVSTKVYKIEQNGEVAYFELWREVPASEIQEGMDLSWGFNEVVPKEVTVIQYVHKEA